MCVIRVAVYVSVHCACCARSYMTVRTYDSGHGGAGVVAKSEKDSRELAYAGHSKARIADHSGALDITAHS